MTPRLDRAAGAAVQPLTPPPGRHYGWMVMVDTYFSSFILAEVTIPNLLGADHHRVRRGLATGCRSGGC